MRLPLILILCLLSAGIDAQEKALLYSHYTFNGLAVNPAFAGSRDMLSLNLSHRNQWMGFEGAPVYNIFAAHAPLKKTSMGVGLLVMNESIGLRRFTGVYANYAHRIDLGSGKLALGLKAGLASGRFGTIDLGDDDAVFGEKAESYLLPNFGVGAYYYTRRFYAGVSVPLIMGYKSNDAGEVVVYHDISKYSVYFTSGITMKVAENWSLQPSVLVNYNGNGAVVADGGLCVLYNEIFRVGATYRTKQAIVLLTDYKINYQLRAGIAYDYGLGGLNEYNRSSLEITLEYNFGYRMRVSNPTIF
jgi:type IX secretion system PorP/SprF family membrane protein